MGSGNCKIQQRGDSRASSPYSQHNVMTQQHSQAVRSYLRQFGRMNRNARLYLLSNVLSSITVGVFTLLYNLYLISLGYQADFIGWLLALGVVGGAAGIALSSPIIGRVGAKAALFWSSVVAGLAGALQLLYPQAVCLLITSFIVGIAGGLYLIIGAPLLAAGSTERSRGHIFSLNAALALVTAVIGQALGGYLPTLASLPAVVHAPLYQAIQPALVAGAKAQSYELALLLAGVIAAPSFVPIILMDPTPPARRHGMRQTDSASEHQESAGKRAIILGWRVRLSAALAEGRRMLRGPIGQLALVEGLIGLGAGLFIPYFNLYFVQYLGVSTNLYGLITAGSTLLMALTTLAGPYFAARLGKVRGTVLAHLASLPFLFTLGLTRALPLVLTAYLVRWSLMNMAEPVLLSFFMSIVPQEQRATANSAYTLSFWSLWALGSLLGGFIIAAGNYTLPFQVACALYLLATFCLWRFFRGKQEIEQPTQPVLESARP
jgi:MFS family permease